MPKTADTMPPAEKTAESPDVEVARLKTEIGQALQPIREAIASGDFNSVKKLYRSLIRTYHEDKYQDETVKAAMREINKAVNQLDQVLKADAPDERRRADLLTQALTQIERQISTTESGAAESALEVSEAEIETESDIIGQELEALGYECQETFDALQAASQKFRELQALQASLDGLSPEFRAAHQAEIQKIGEATAALHAKLNDLNSRYTQTQMQVSFFRYYQEETAALTDAPRIMGDLARQAEAVAEYLIGIAADFERETRIAETLNRQMEKHQAEYLALQTERMKVAQWQAFLDHESYGLPPFTQAFNDNRRNRQRYDEQDLQLFGRMQSLTQAMHNLYDQQMANTRLRQQLWQSKLSFEAQGSQIHATQAATYESISRRHAALSAARNNIVQTVSERKKGRTRPPDQAEA
jgi:hypothetical protein